MSTIEYVMDMYENFRLVTQGEKITFYKAADEIIKPLSKNDIWCKVDRDFEGVHGICENGYAAKYSSNDQYFSFGDGDPCVQASNINGRENEISCQEMLELMRAANYHMPDEILNPSKTGYYTVNDGLNSCVALLKDNEISRFRYLRSRSQPVKYSRGSLEGGGWNTSDVRESTKEELDWFENSNKTFSEFETQKFVPLPKKSLNTSEQIELPQLPIPKDYEYLEFREPVGDDEYVSQSNLTDQATLRNVGTISNRSKGRTITNRPDVGRSRWIVRKKTKYQELIDYLEENDISSQQVIDAFSRPKSQCIVNEAAKVKTSWRNMFGRIFLG